MNPPLLKVFASLKSPDFLRFLFGVNSRRACFERGGKFCERSLSLLKCLGLEKAPYHQRLHDYPPEGMNRIKPHGCPAEVSSSVHYIHACVDTKTNQSRILTIVVYKKYLQVSTPLRKLLLVIAIFSPLMSDLQTTWRFPWNQNQSSCWIMILFQF
jgi:hypothetical protein